MNWATLAPESRLYKGKNLFRWDVSPGLEHHCGVCATPLHNSRAKTSCLGKHVEPCYRFHQQLHFVGKSHECFGCNSSDELHHNRHKEILTIVRQITIFDQGNTATTVAKPTGGGQSRRGSITTSTTSPTDTSSETFGVENIKLTRRERKKAKKTGNGGAAKDKNNPEVFAREEVDFISEAIHLKIHESKGAWEGTYIYDSKPTPGEDDQEDDLCEADNEESASIVPDAGSYSVKSPSLMTPRQRRVIKKFYTPVSHSSFRGGSRKFSPRIVSVVDPCDGVDPQIFFRLGIEVNNPPQNSKARKELVAKLVAAVKEDLEIMEREEKESAMREEGFWRWAGRTAYNAIKRTREDLDWATGQKIGTPRRELYPEIGDMGQEELEEGLAAIAEQYPETLSPVMQRDEPTFADMIARPTMYLEVETMNKKAEAKKPDATFKKLAKATTTPAEDLVKVEDDGWSVVTRSKGSAKQPKWETPKVAYRKPGDHLTISLK